MKISKCRVCKAELIKQPLLSYDGMPKAAQYLPDRLGIKSDRGVALAVCQCSGCGLVQLTSRPVSYYKEVIRAAAFSPEMQAFRAKQFAGFVRRYALKGRKIVEIGCGHGEYLEIMQEQGVKAFGLEQSVTAVAQCFKKGLKVSKGFVGQANVRIPGGPFAGFFMMSFLEHVPDPAATLSGIRHNLENGAVGLIEVPNFDLIMRQELFAEFIPDHLCYFTKDTLATALRLSGFEILDCRPVWHDYIRSAVVKKRAVIELSGFRARQARLKTQLKAALREFRNKEVAIWGAGHQALALIALLGIADKIKYVVDSASFKQGRYTPATHLPIVHPDRLESDPVRGVLVLAGSYSAEVIRTIRQKYDKRMKLFALQEGMIRIV
jgi:SAM-dependent methyltransferase